MAISPSVIAQYAIVDFSAISKMQNFFLVAMSLTKINTAKQLPIINELFPLVANKEVSPKF